MKKFFYLLLAAMFAFAFTSCSDDDDEGGAGTDNSKGTVVDGQPVVGSYESTMASYLKEMPEDLSKSSGTLTVQQAANGKVNVVLPIIGSGSMSIPSITLEDLVVYQKDNVYTFGVENLEGTVLAGEINKNYTVTFIGEVNVDGTYRFHEEIKYGNMPFTNVIDYTKYSLSSVVSGGYKSLLSVTMEKVPGEPSLSRNTVKLIENNASSVSVVLPSYTAAGRTIPEITLEGLEVTEKDGGYTFEKNVNGGSVNGANYDMVFSGEIKADGSYKFHEEVKYGGMPLTIFIDYTPYSHAALLAKDYKVDYEVSIKEMPNDGVQLTGTDVIKIQAGKFGALNVVLPSMTYQMAPGKSMVIPALTAEKLNVKELADGATEMSVSFKGKEAGTEKEYTIEFKGLVKADGSYEFSSETKYGLMPLTLVAAYKQPAPQKK